MAALFILAIICCGVCSYWGFSGQAVPFVAGLGWLTLVVINITNLITYYKNKE